MGKIALYFWDEGISDWPDSETSIFIVDLMLQPSVNTDRLAAALAL